MQNSTVIATSTRLVKLILCDNLDLNNNQIWVSNTVVNLNINIKPIPRPNIRVLHTYQDNVSLLWILKKHSLLRIYLGENGNKEAINFIFCLNLSLNHQASVLVGVGLTKRTTCVCNTDSPSLQPSLPQDLTSQGPRASPSQTNRMLQSPSDFRQQLINEP